MTMYSSYSYSSRSSSRGSLDFGRDRWSRSSYTPHSSYRPFISTYKPFERSSIYYGGGRHRRFNHNSHRPIIEHPRRPPCELPSASNSLQFDVLNAENRKKHHTENYGVKSLVVRRGESFNILLQIPASHKKSELQQLTVTFSTGSSPQENKDTGHNFKLKPKASEHAKSLGGWQASVMEATSEHIKLQITPTADAVVGGYTVKVKVKAKTESGKDAEITGILEPIYVLFNAWCKDDDVYLEDEQERQEYVMNESGRVYRGINQHGPVGVPWTFGQFARASLEGAMYLLDKSAVAKSMHGHSVMVVRAISAMVNCNDDNGVLQGRWDGNYREGRSPTEWVSSISIMEQYVRYKQPVRFGQCWVFSAVAVTVCRALGIPCRSVTNFDSAHDTDGSLTIDRHFDPHGHSLAEMDDSVWNFHVWNEAWMHRHDLPHGYDGWQAFDSTPQETSDGKMQCGPAPVRAIKEGDVFLNYDARFIFAEVNGDRLVWICDQSTGTMQPIKTELETSAVGNFISTKAVGSTARMDITRQYKYEEGSSEERKAVLKACQFACAVKKKSLAHNVYNTAADVKFGCKGSCDQGDLRMEVSIVNVAKETRSGFVRVNATANYYTGIAAETLDSKRYEFRLEPGQDKVGVWKLPATKYMNDIDEDADVHVTIVGYIEETQQYFMYEKPFPIDKEDIKIETNNKRPKVGQDFDITVSLKNPVKMHLTHGILHIEGPGIQKDFEHRIGQPIDPLTTFTKTFTLTPKYAGKREIVASFKSAQLVGFAGSLEVEVQP